MISRLSSMVVLGVVLLVGCSDSTKNDVSAERLAQMSGGALKPTVPVSGKVLVDGTPQSGVELFLHSATDGALVGSCRTGENGEYAWTTYVNGDGLPAASYRLAFAYVPKQRKNDEGKDMFKGKYKNPLKNKFELVVAEGTPQTNVDYELKSK